MNLQAFDTVIGQFCWKVFLMFGRLANIFARYVRCTRLNFNASRCNPVEKAVTQKKG